jgi:hypothetical protein
MIADSLSADGLQALSWCDLDGGGVMNVCMRFERLMATKPGVAILLVNRM